MTHALRPRRARSRSSFELAPTSPSTLSLAASQSRPVKGWLVASNYPLGQRERLATRPADDEKDASLRLLQPTQRYEHPTDDSIPEFASLRTSRSFERLGPLDGVSRCWDNPGGASLDGDPPASAKATTLAGNGRGISLDPRPAVASSGPGGCCDRQPLRTAPPGRGVFDRVPSSLPHLWRPLSRPTSSGPKPVECGEPDPISPPPRQSRWSLRARAPSIDQCPLAGTRHRSHGFAAASRLPTPIRSPCRRWFPTGDDELDPRIAARAGRLWSTSATKTIREHALRTARSPASSWSSPPVAGAGGSCLDRHGSEDP